MSRLFRNKVIATWPKSGELWLCQLDEIINQLADQWCLSEIQPFEHLSYHYVAAARQKQKAVVVKIGCDGETIEREYIALNALDGKGSVKVLDFDQARHALLLVQAISGKTLKSHCNNDIERGIAHYAYVVHALHATNGLKPEVPFPHVRSWLAAIDRLDDNRVDNKLIDKAKYLSEKLLTTMKNECLCHGDLHLDNIVKDGEKWLAIDPKGVIGETAFEAAAFDWVFNAELMAQDGILIGKIARRLERLSSALSLDAARLTAWVFLRFMFSIAWLIEDKGDYRSRLRLAKLVYRLL